MSKNLWTNEQIEDYARGMAERTGFSLDTCRAMLRVGQRGTKRDDHGRLLADKEDIEDIEKNGGYE